MNLRNWIFRYMNGRIITRCHGAITQLHAWFVTRKSPQLLHSYSNTHRRKSVAEFARSGRSVATPRPIEVGCIYMCIYENKRRCTYTHICVISLACPEPIDFLAFPAEYFFARKIVRWTLSPRYSLQYANVYDMYNYMYIIQNALQFFSACL